MGERDGATPVDESSSESAHVPGSWTSGVAFPLLVWVGWRFCHLLLLLRSGGFNDRLFFLDAGSYLDIMHRGYADPEAYQPNTAFFPLISWIARPLASITGSDVAAGHLVATATSIGAFVCLWGFTAAWRDEKTARRAVVLFALWPGTAFLTAFFSEGLFVLAAAGALWADRRGRHGLAALGMAAATATRTVGFLIPAVVVVFRVVRARGLDRIATAYLGAGVLGLVVVVGAMHVQAGDGTAFLRDQDDWGRELTDPLTTIRNGVELVKVPDRPDLPPLSVRALDLLAVAFVVVPIAAEAVSHDRRWPPEVLVLSGLLVLPALLSGLLISFTRFVVADAFVFALWSTTFDRLPPRAGRPALITAAIILALATISFGDLYAQGYWVG